jgi:hypothetical protein
MLSNKIIADRPLAGNENRAHIHKGGRYQEMTPRSADGPIADGRIDPANSVPGNEMPPGILNPNSMPMMKDAHANARHSNENRTAMPGEKSRTAYADENRRRIYGRDVKYR